MHTLNTVRPNCTRSNGSIDIAMTGGKAPYSYNWQPNVSNTSSARNLSSGAYTVTVVDNNQCYKIINIALPDLSDLTASVSTTRNISCFGASDGIAVTTATGGNGPYSYLWSPSGRNTAVNNNLAAGIHNVTVTDANGCKTIATATIPQPPALTSALKLQHTFCGNDNGKADVEVRGGTGPYQYTWSPGNYTSAAAVNLAPGQHTVVITDKNGCTKNDTAIIFPSSAIQPQITQANVSCAGGLTGSIRANVSGGTTPYSFQWTGPTQTYHR